jgi:hypothetical protein
MIYMNHFWCKEMEASPFPLHFLARCGVGKKKWARRCLCSIAVSILHAVPGCTRGDRPWTAWQQHARVGPASSLCGAGKQNATPAPPRSGDHSGPWRRRDSTGVARVPLRCADLVLRPVVLWFRPDQISRRAASLTAGPREIYCHQHALPVREEHVLTRDVVRCTSIASSIY